MYNNDELILIYESIATEIIRGEDALTQNIPENDKEEIIERLKELRALLRKTETYIAKNNPCNDKKQLIR